MNRSDRAAFLFACMVGLSGCAVHPAKVSTTIPQAMAGIQSSLAQAGVVSVSHASDWTPAQDALFVRAIRAAQCSQDRADPVVGTIAGDVTLQLSGQFTQGGQFSVGQSRRHPHLAHRAMPAGRAGRRSACQYHTRPCPPCLMWRWDGSLATRHPCSRRMMTRDTQRPRG